MSLTRRKTLFALAATACLSACGGASESSDDIEWTEVPRQADADTLNSICYGNSMFVAAVIDVSGANRAVSCSVDGRSWTAVPLPVTGGGWITAVAFGHGRFVAISTEGDIFESVDGKTWNVVFRDASAAFAAIAFGNDRFVISGTFKDGWISMTWHSLDGLAWSEPVSSDVGFTLSPLKFVNGTLFSFVAASRLRMLWMSNDSGTSWSQAHVEVDGQDVDVASMTYGNGLYVAATDAGDILTSTDAVSWKKRHRFDATNYTNLSFLDSTFVLTNGRSILRSADGLSWDDAQVGQRGDILDSVAFDGRQFVAVGYPGLVMLGPVV